MRTIVPIHQHPSSFYINNKNSISRNSNKIEWKQIFLYGNVQTNTKMCEKKKNFCCGNNLPEQHIDFYLSINILIALCRWNQMLTTNPRCSS